jgi:hypothetical protein
VRKRQKIPFDHPVVGTGNAANLVRQQRFDHRPLEIRQIKPRHSTLQQEGLNQLKPDLGIWRLL